MLAEIPTDLISAPLDELAERARSIRDLLFGNRITYSPKVFIPLTRLCRDRCGYCTFATAPARLESPYLTPEQVLDIARAGASAGCTEALFTLGEAPEDRYPVASEWLTERGYSSTVDYLAQMCALVRDETGLLPHANAGALSPEDLSTLRSVSASQGMMLETIADVPCHNGSPDKVPARRLATLEAAGRLAIPFTTGLLVGIGDTRVDRIAALEAIADIHRTYGNIQEVIIQNFLPKPGTSMHKDPACPPDEHLWTIAVARLLLPLDVHLQAPPNLTDDVLGLVAAGIDDLGGISPITLDHVNPERAWPEITKLRNELSTGGFDLVARLTIYPEYAVDSDEWLDPQMRFSVLDSSDAEGLARDDTWSSGGDTEPPLLIDPEHISNRAPSPVTSRSAPGLVAPMPSTRDAVGEVLASVVGGQLPDEDQIVTLFSARGRNVGLVCEVADQMRQDIVGDAVTWVANRNINYTNVCTFKCRFCAFSKGPLSLNLRGAPYLLELSDITDRVREAEEAGATEVCLQGGIHPSFDGDYYIHVIEAVREASSRIHIHGFTALEVSEGARRLEEPLAVYLARLKDAGLATLPGTAAEILDDEIRKILCPDKINTEEWLEVHRTAHQIGLRSNITIMFGAVEHPRSWARHIVRTRNLQLETGGFTEFVPLPFVHMAAPIYLQHKARRGPTFRESLLMHAVGRIAYGSLVPNIQVSWVKMGTMGVRQTLRAGANDLGGTLMDENISRAAGASHGQRMDEESFHSMIEPLGRRLEQRTTLYGRVAAAC